jgi:ferredoxin-type protein NapH
VGLIQNGIFVVLFAALVVVLPLLTKKRTQCSFFCPFGAFQSILMGIPLTQVGPISSMPGWGQKSIRGM